MYVFVLSLATSVQKAHNILRICFYDFKRTVLLLTFIKKSKNLFNSTNKSLKKFL